MAVAYSRQVLYTESQMRALRIIHEMHCPTINEVVRRVNWKRLDHLFNKGVIRQQGDVLILTARGQWAVQHTSQRIVKYHRKEEAAMCATLEIDTDELPSNESDTMLDEFAEQPGTVEMDDTTADELKRDCLDYAKDQGELPDAQHVQAWAEMMCIRLTKRQAQGIIKAAEKEQDA